MRKFCVGVWLTFAVITALPAQPGMKVERLAGIVQYAGQKRALLDLGKSRFGTAQSCLLAEGQREENLEMLRIDASAGEVKLRMNGADELSFKLRDQTNLPVSGIVWEEVGLQQVLREYAEATGRTLLQSPRLPECQFSLRAAATNAAEVALKCIS